MLTVVEFPVIALEAQKDVGATSIKQHIEYCLQGSEQYNYKILSYK
jgi:hypothetical protein